MQLEEDEARNLICQAQAWRECSTYTEGVPFLHEHPAYPQGAYPPS